MSAQPPPVSQETNPSPQSVPPGRRTPFDWAFAIVAALGLGSAALVWWREGAGVVREVLLHDTELLLSILPKVLAGTAIGAFVRLLVPAESVRRIVGSESGLRGLIVAALAGAIFPGGPFTIFPLTAAFLVIGADRGAAVAFVTGWLLLGLNRAIIWEMPFLGADFILLRMAISLPMPVLAGMLARATLRHGPWREEGQAP